jgi:hypothetical protein
MSLIEYLARTALCLTCFYLTYRVLLHNKCHHSVNRFYLMGSFLAAFFIPLFTIDLSLIKMPVIESVENAFPQKVDAVFAGNAPLITEKPIPPDHDGISWTVLVSLVYFGGLVVFLIRYGLDLFRLILLIKKNTREKYRDYTLVKLPWPVAPFSFFRFVFVCEKDVASDDFGRFIIRHELAHIRSWHSIDSLFLGLGRVIQWFNPVTLYYKKAVTALHEFSADRAVIENQDTLCRYQQKILKYAYIKNNIAFISSFSSTMIKNRFIMMTKQNPGRHRTFRVIASVAVAAILLLAFSSGDKIGVKSLSDGMNLVPSLEGQGDNELPVIYTVPDTSGESVTDRSGSGDIQNKEDDEEIRILNEELGRIKHENRPDSFSCLPHVELYMNPEIWRRRMYEMQDELKERQLRIAERQLRLAEEQKMLAERLRPLREDCQILPDQERLRKMAEAQERLEHLRPLLEENLIIPQVPPFHFDGDILDLRDLRDLRDLNLLREEQLRHPDRKHLREQELLRSLDEKDLKMMQEQKEWREKYRREMEKQRDQMEKTRQQLMDEYEQMMRKYRKEEEHD